jgi:predicted extracellular nuclease
MKKIFCSWWNLENLFDVEGAFNRSDKLNRAIGKDLIGWTDDVLELKLNQLSSIINKINNQKGPDIIGVCEVENKTVLERLVSKLSRRTYKIVHADCLDERGIDVAFIYDSILLEAKEIFNHFVMRRNATRDIVQVNFNLLEEGKIIVFIGNHWPSRTDGVYESEPYRMIAGETLAYFHKRIYEVLENEQVPVIVMGDFNDNPFNRSIIEYALSTNSKERILNALQIKYFYNLMWSMLANDEGSYYFNGFNLLDQFLVSGNIIKNESYLTIVQNSCQIVKYPEMHKNGRPIRFGKPKDSGGINRNGFSDHFPISMELCLP